MPGDLYTAVMAIPGADRAVDFIQAQAAAFSYIPQRLERVRAKLEAIRQAAAAQNDVVKVAKAAALLRGLLEVQRTYARTSAGVSDVVNALRSTAPGINPLAFVPKLLAVAGQVTLLFKSTEAFERSAGGLQAGTLSPAEIARLERGGFTVGSAVVSPLVKTALVVGGVYLVYRMMRR